MHEMQIIARAQKNDHKAIEMLYGKYQTGWFMICLRYCKNRDDALDVLQNTLIKIFTHIRKFDEERGNFKNWSSRIVVNENLMFLRKNNKSFRSIEVNENLEIFDDSDSVLDLLSTQELTNMIQQLPTGFRTVFNLYVIEGYSHKEIGEMLGISIGTSKSQLFKAKKITKNKIGSTFITDWKWKTID